MKSYCIIVLLFLSFAASVRAASQGVLASDWVFELDEGRDGSIDYRYTTTNSYDHRGRFTGSVTLFDSDGNGTIDESDVNTWTYDERGRLLQSVYEIDFGNNGTVDWRGVTTVTGAKDQTVETTVVDWDMDGSTDYTLISTTSFNQQRQPLLNIQNYDYGTNNFPPFRIVTSWTYDAREDQVIMLAEEFQEDEDTPDRISRATTTLNHRQQPVLALTEVLLDPFGRTRTETSTYTYDRTGNLTRWETESVVPTSAGMIRSLWTLTGTHLQRNDLTGTRHLQ